MPDLRPYTSLAWIPAVLRAGILAARRRRQSAPERKAARRAAKARAAAAGEPVGRARLVAMAADYLTGTRLLLGHLSAWLSGEYGPKDMKVPARLATSGFTGYCLYRTATTWPLWGPVGITVVYCAATLGALHRHRAEHPREQPPARPPRHPARPPPRPRPRVPSRSSSGRPTRPARRLLQSPR